MARILIRPSVREDRHRRGQALLSRCGPWEPPGLGRSPRAGAGLGSREGRVRSCGAYYYRGGSNAQLFATITAGIQGGQMGAFASSLTGDQIWKIIAFLRDQTRRDHPEAFSQD